MVLLVVGVVEVVVVTIVVGAIGFGTTDVAVSLAVEMELFGELNIAELNPGSEMLSIRDDGPAVAHSSNDNRFALGFFFAFNS